MRNQFLAALVVVGAMSMEAQAGPVLSGLAEWYEANAGVLNASNSAAASGQGVQTWQNQSAGGATFNVGQTTVASQPTYNPTGLNGHPALIFNGASVSVLDNLSVDAVGDNSSRTVFVVAQADNGSGVTGGTLFTSRTTDQVDTMLRLNWSDGNHYVYSDGSFQNITASHGPGFSAFVSAYIQTSTSGTALPGTVVGSLSTQLNGVTEVLSSPPSVLSESAGGTGFSIGNRLETAGQGWTGAIAEVLVYDRTLSAAEINQTGFYLAQKYGLLTSYTPEPSAAMLLCVASAAGLLVVGRRRLALARKSCA